MPGRRPFLRRRHVAAADAGTGHYRGHRDPAGVFDEARRCRRGAWASWLRSGSRRGRVIRAQAVSSAGQARAPVPSRCGRLRRPLRRFLASAEPLPVVGPDDPSHDRHPEPPAARLGRACPCPATARRRRELADEITTPSAEFAGPATGADQDMRLCGGYSGYSEDTTADSVSSPMPRASGGYSEDTQNGA
jgi:hypothetical protein